MDLHKRNNFGVRVAISAGVVLVVMAGFIGGFLLNQFFGFSEYEGTTKIFHYSPFSKQDFFETAFTQAQKTTILESKTRIQGITVNHHLLVPNLIARAFLTVSKQQTPDTILLISPNHFDAGRHTILLSSAEWQTPYGTLMPNLSVIKNLSAEGLTIDEPPFEKEHGIYNIVSFIKKVFQTTKIVPIILKESLKPEQSKLLAELLQKTLPKNTLIILSADFSHYTTNAQAMINDKKTIGVIQKLDINSVRDLAIDTHPGLELFLHLMNLYGAKNWTLLDNTNAEQIIGRTPEEGVTSYINGFFGL